MSARSARLAAIDAAYLYAERPGYPMHVGSVATFEAGPLLDAAGRLRLDDLRALVASRLDLLPRLRRRVALTPLDLDRPRWVDDAEFDVANHVDVVEAPAPGDDDALRAVAVETWCELLDRRHPLWHVRFVTGLDGGRVGLVQRAHHSLVDGVSGVDVAAALLDLTPEVTPPPPSTWRPTPPVPAPVAALDGIRDRMADAAHLASTAFGLAVHPSRVPVYVDHAREVVRTVLDEGLAPHSSLNVPTGPKRRLAWIRADLAAVKAAGAKTGATANDVVLSAVAAGLQHTLLSRGETVAADSIVKVLVPVSVRRADERGALGNRVSALTLALPIGIADPTERVAAITERTERMKAGPDAEASQGLLRVADLLPMPAIRLLGSLAHRQPFYNLVVTNVPGPNLPLYMLGARMLEAFPIVPLAGDLSLGVAVLSYDGALNIGLTADVDTCGDLDVVVEGIERGLREAGATRARRRRVHSVA